MPELRRDPVVGRWVIVAPERADRPNAVVRTLPDQDDPASCPFCPGHEAITPPELLVRRDNAGPPNGPGWTLRVVPNRFPALRTEERMVRAGLGMYDAMGGVGAHEVIIETPEHARAMPQQSPEQVEQVLRAAQERILDLSRDVRLRSVLFFKNSGAASGATLSHPHSQIVALPLVPTELQQELAGAERHYEEKERCIFCDILAQEARERSRVVLETDGFMALSPRAVRAARPAPRAPLDLRAEHGGRAAWALRGAAPLAAQARPCAGQAGLQFLSAHTAAARAALGLVSLAPGVEANPRAGGRLRVGQRPLRQPHPAGGGRRLPPPDGGVE